MACWSLLLNLWWHWLLSQVRMQQSLHHLSIYYIKALIYKPPLAFNMQERESCRHIATMWLDRKHCDILLRRERNIFSTVQPPNRSKLSVLSCVNTLALSHISNSTIMNNVPHNTSANCVNVRLQVEKQGQK